jgi:transposase
MLGIDENRYPSVRFFRDPATKAWKRYEPWMTTIVDLDTGQVLGIVEGRDSEGLGTGCSPVRCSGAWACRLLRSTPRRRSARPCGCGCRAPPSQLTRSTWSSSATTMLTEVRQRLTQQVHGRRGRSIDPVWANRRLLLRAGDTLSERARDRLSTVFATDDVTGKLQAAWLVKEQLRALLATGSLADAAAAKDRLQVLVERAAQPETNRLWRTVCRWWKEIEVLIVTGATTAKVEANNTAIKHIKRTGPGFTNARNYKTRILLRSAARTAA